MMHCKMGCIQCTKASFYFLWLHAYKEPVLYNGSTKTGNRHFSASFSHQYMQPTNDTILYDANIKIIGLCILAFVNKLTLSFDQIIFAKLRKKLLSSYNQARLSPKTTPLSKKWNGHQIPTESDHQCFLHILAKMVLDALILEAFIFSSRRLKHFFLQTIDEPNILEG